MTSGYSSISILLLAITIDLLFGEPTNRFHPVAWMGKGIGLAKRVSVQHTPSVSFILGLGIVVLGSSIVGTIGWMLESVLSTTNNNSMIQIVLLFVHAIVLKCCFGIRSLSNAAIAVLTPLQQQDEPKAREQLAYHLVSRDVSVLSKNEISAATIESVAENMSDSIVAPLFYYTVAGLPGALIYRYVNTCDAMLGYRTLELEWLGKAAARIDDCLNLAPARITAALMILANLCSPTITARACKTWWQDAALTDSPNAGHPMSVASGVLGVRLTKANHYTLGKDFRLPESTDINTMLSLLNRTLVLTVVLALLVCAAIGYQSSRSSF